MLVITNLDRLLKEKSEIKKLRLGRIINLWEKIENSWTGTNHTIMQQLLTTVHLVAVSIYTMFLIAGC
jgi:hypothetical protein